jgi:hypothetical protein
MKVLKSMMKERMADPDRPCGDFFDHVIQELRREKPLLTETIALDLMFVLLFASFETTALALTLGVKLLTDNPKVVEALRVSKAKLQSPSRNRHKKSSKQAKLTEQIVFFICVVEQEEHDAIVRNCKDPDAPVTWAEYRSMKFTNQVCLTLTTAPLELREMPCQDNALLVLQ